LTDQEQHDQYRSMRSKFEPARVSFVILAESPPVSGKYFYDPDGKVSEPLFSALMKQLNIQPTTKLEGLAERRGCILVDATYEPVNALDKRNRNLAIIRNYDALRDDLKRLLDTRWNEIPIILVKGECLQAVGAKVEGGRVQRAQ
jgi:hypothetical protein